MNISRWFVSLLVLAGLLINPLQSVTALSEPPPKYAGVSLTPEEVESFLDEFTAEYMPELDVPGLAFVMVKDGEIFFSKGYGYADVENKTPFDPERTIVRGGSIVKTVTALAVMQLAEQGKIDLDADVNQYLTHFQLPDAFDKPIITCVSDGISWKMLTQALESSSISEYSDISRQSVWRYDLSNFTDRFKEWVQI